MHVAIKQLGPFFFFRDGTVGGAASAESPPMRTRDLLTWLVETHACIPIGDSSKVQVADRSVEDDRHLSGVETVSQPLSRTLPSSLM